VAKIIVVDDEKNVADLVSFILKKDGHTVVTAEDGPSGYEIIQTENPDLVILDVMMPGMDGYTLCTKLGEEYETRNLPVIMLTGKGQMKDVFSMTQNVKAYVEKPFEPDDLSDKVRQALVNRAG
jgi:DNA-binding response OmpR family regulator